ncbi:hypothetical protein ACIRVK_40595 [Streptomyces sp. NPDC101152]|uniref:hypothetical protein n=1 Tax=Streptomyces sp. NPDC101152 TaxID=3366116 RepID=UPI0037F39041
MLIVADDAQWLDESSAHCLAFPSRRLRNEPVTMLITGHDDPVGGPWEKLPAMEVRELGDDDARLLVRAVAPQADESVIRRTTRAAGGNPLALQELTASVAAGDISTHPFADECIAVGPRLRRAFRARIEKLSATARTALLLAADDRSDRNTMRQAGLVLGLDAVASDEAMHSGLRTKRSDGRVCFRHQLTGAVVYEPCAARPPTM